MSTGFAVSAHVAGAVVCLRLWCAVWCCVAGFAVCGAAGVRLVRCVCLHGGVCAVVLCVRFY